MQTLSDVIRRTRSLLEEPAPPTTNYGAQRYYTDTELTDWINDACRDIARRTEDLENLSTTTSAIAGTGSYSVPSDLIRLHRVEFIPTGSTQLYPIEIRDRNTVDQLIGFNPQIQSSYPWVCWLWGTPNNVTYPLTLSFYPVFSTGGQINLWYFRLPTRLTDPASAANAYAALVEVPEGWDDLVVEYAVARGYQKQKNSEWLQRKQEYENHLQSMIDITRQWHDQANRIMPNRERWSMGWLYDFDT